MNIINQANYYMNVVIFATVFITGVLGLIIYYLIKVRKVTASEEHIQYDVFNRNSVMEYIKFDNVISDMGSTSLKGAGMLVLDNYTFISGLEVVGYNFNHASADEKQRTMVNAIAFVNILDEPIQLRQTVESIDISFNIEQFKSARHELLYRLDELSTQYNALVLSLDNVQEDIEIQETILKNIHDMEMKMESMKWKIKEADEIIRYESVLQKGSANSKKVNQVMFSYHFNPDEFSEELTQQEIYIKAMNALQTKSGIYASSLENCGCSAKPLEAEKLIDLIRKHMHPLTGDEMTMDEVLTSSVSALFVTSDSLFDLEREKMGEQAYTEMMNSEEDKQSHVRLKAYQERDQEIQRMMNKINSYDTQIVQELQLER